MNHVYDIADGARISAEFRDIDGNLVDPVTVTFKFKLAGGSQSTKVYGTDPEIVKDSTGKYHTDVTFAMDGFHYYRWETTSPAGAEEKAIKVIASQFFP